MARFFEFKCLEDKHCWEAKLLHISFRNWQFLANGEEQPILYIIIYAKIIELQITYRLSLVSKIQFLNFLNK